MSTTSIKDRIRRAKEARTATKPIRVWLAPDMGLVEQYQQALVDLEKAQEGGDPADSLEGNQASVAAQERVEQLRAQVDECALELTVRALSDDEWQELIDQHPPRRKTDTQEADPRDAEAGWNTTTFPGALLRAGTVAPELDDEDWLTLLGAPGQPGVLTHPQIQDAAGEVLRLSRFRIDVPFS